MVGRVTKKGKIVVIHVQAAKKLAPEDYKLIEEEHLRLHRYLKNLRSTCWNLDNQRSCQSCTREKLATCQGRIVSFFYNIINISANHFNHEESIILRWSQVRKEDEDFRIHQQAHDNILQELNTVVSECASLDAQGETAQAYRQLYRKILEQFEEHDRLFDSIYINGKQTEKTDFLTL